MVPGIFGRSEGSKSLRIGRSGIGTQKQCEALSPEYECIHNLAEAHCKEMNRPVRTRTPGGVGGASEQSGSLSRSLFVFCDSFSRFGLYSEWGWDNLCFVCLRAYWLALYLVFVWG